IAPPIAEEPKAQAPALITETGGAQGTRLPRGSVVSKRGQTAIPGMEGMATEAESRDEAAAKVHRQLEDIRYEMGDASAEAARETLVGLGPHIEKALAEEPELSSETLADSLAEDVPLPKDGLKRDSTRRQLLSNLMRPAIER